MSDAQPIRELVPLDLAAHSRYLPEPHFATGIHLHIVQAEPCRGAGWVNGRMVRAIGASAEALAADFIARYGQPATHRVFVNQAEAHSAYPDFYL